MKIYKKIVGYMQQCTEYNIIDAQGENDNSVYKINVTTDIEKNKNILTKRFKNSIDVIFHDLEVHPNTKVLMVYIEGMVDHEVLNRDVIPPLMVRFDKNNVKKSLNVSNVKEVNILYDGIDEILEGNTAIFIDGSSAAYVINTKKLEKRAIDVPDTEVVIRGSREGFIETIGTNMSLIRRKVKNDNLIFEGLKIGKQTKTAVVIAYIDGIVNEKILIEVRKRLNQINLDSILESGYIEQFIEDAPLSPFPTIGNTQKPDIAAAKLLEGRIAILCDGTPHVLTIPYLFLENLQTGEDYYQRTILGTFARILRFISLVISVLLPSLYVAFSNYHQEMIPPVLLISMSGSREDIPFPASLEAFIMMVTFEILRESGIRLPRAIGSAISIVGALVLGESAVNAGLISAPMVIIVAITAVASFVNPTLVEVLIVLRFTLLILSGVMGLYGIVCGLFLVMAHAVSLRSFGVPYTSPAAPFTMDNMKDYFFRFPLWFMKLRPQYIVKNNVKRQANTRRR